MAELVQKQLRAIAAHLRQRREPLLQEWRELIDLDPQITSYRRLGRRELDDHIPQALENLDLRLRAEHEIAATEADLRQLATAAEHAGQRWRVGYHLREALGEWGHLHRLLLTEITRYVAEHCEVERDTYYAACLALGEWITESVSESANRYVDLHRAEAANRVAALQKSLDELQEMENERASLLRQSAHDLRGSAAVIANVSSLLERPQLKGSERQRFYTLLQRRIQVMGDMLTQLMVSARLETGSEALQLEQFDAAERLRGLCDVLRPIAVERSLLLDAEGAPSLMVETDAIKLQRIVQNLLLNAIRATEQGSVTVRWCAEPDGVRWTLSVQDTGPGFDPSAIHRASKAQKSEARHQISSKRGESVAEYFPQNEGIGLRIVERLCEVLKGILTIESAPGQGTTVRITLPLSLSRTTPSRASAEGGAARLAAVRSNE